MPPTQGGPSFRDVTSAPHDPEMVDFFPRLVIRDKDVEIPTAYTVEHVQNGLLRSPSSRRFFSGGVGTRNACVRPSRTGGFMKRRTVPESEDSHEQMGSQIGNRSALT